MSSGPDSPLEEVLPAEKESRPTEPQIARQNPGIKTILVVDDHAINRRVMLGMLTHCGHRMLEAESGAEALKMVRKEKADLVIADVLMPGMDGYELVQAVAQ